MFYTTELDEAEQSIYWHLLRCSIQLNCMKPSRAYIDIYWNVLYNWIAYSRPEHYIDSYWLFYTTELHDTGQSIYWHLLICSTQLNCMKPSREYNYSDIYWDILFNWTVWSRAEHNIFAFILMHMIQLNWMTTLYNMKSKMFCILFVTKHVVCIYNNVYI